MSIENSRVHIALHPRRRAGSVRLERSAPFARVLKINNVSWAIVAVASVLTLSGCSSMMSRSCEYPGVYPGVYNSAQMLASPEESAGMKVFMAVDLPLSAGLDTAMLPFDLGYWIAKGAGDNESSEPLTNQPPVTSIVRFETAPTSVKRVRWRPLPRQDGEFILAMCAPLSEWEPKWPGGGVPGCILPPPNEFSIRAVTKGGQEYHMTFTTGAGLVWIGDRLLDVPEATSTQVVQRVYRALRQK